MLICRSYGLPAQLPEPIGTLASSGLFGLCFDYSDLFQSFRLHPGGSRFQLTSSGRNGVRQTLSIHLVWWHWSAQRTFLDAR